MESSLAYSNTKPWGDMLYEEEQNRKLALLRMPQPEWLACVNAYFNTLRGNGRALLSALAWAQQVSAERVAFNRPVVPRPEPTEAERAWRVWKDMVEEPYKYGSDIGEWIAVDEEVRAGPKRWRVDAYWYGLVQEMEAEQKENAAVKLQALWRGYQTRHALAPRFTCARCLKHGVCHTEWDEETAWLCAECDVEWTALLRKLGEELAMEEEMERMREEFEAAESTEEVCDDCGEEIVMYGAAVGQLHLCPDCIHDWELCDRCDQAKPLGKRCGNHCSECGEELTGLGGGHGGFCSAECRLEYIRDCCRDERYR